MGKTRSKSRSRASLVVAALPLAAAVLLCGPAARGQTFPSSFAPLYCERGLMTDGYRDQSGAVDERDIVGTAVEPAAFRAIDDQFLYLRLRLDASPAQGQGLTPFAWGFVISTDGDPTNYEILIAADGGNDTVALYRNTATDVPDSPADPAEQLVATYPFVQNGRVVDAGPSLYGGGNDAFLDLAVPWSDLGGLGLAPGTLITIWAASSTNADRLNGDFACHEGGGGTIVPSLSSTAPASLTPDPATSPGPSSGATGDGGGGNIVGASGLEGGPGCDCSAAGREGGGGLGPLALSLLALFSARRRRARSDTVAGMAKSACPISKTQFLEKAEAVKVLIGTSELVADKREFSTGSFGWYHNGKVTITVDGKPLSVQVGINLTVVGSKEAER